MLSTAIQRHPSIRFLLPLAVGIAIRWYMPISHNHWIWAFLFLSWLILVAERFLHKKADWVFGVAFNISLVCCGYLLTSRQLAKTDYNFIGKAEHYLAIVKEHPQEKPRTFLLQADVYEHNDSYHRFLLYVAKDEESASIVRGDTILLKATLRAPTNENTGDFDYVSYLKRKGVTGTAYVGSKNWSVKGHNHDKSLIQHLQDYRETVIDKYRSLGFKGDALAVLSALTTGLKDDLSDEIRETYSIAGVSHVLALSGLHVGLIYGFLLLLLTPLWKRTSYAKPLSICIIICTLWGFAIFTGLSTSVVRSTIMFSVHAIALLREERPATLHILALTAFGMLLYNPLWLFDVSFQLSFIAVAAIITLQPIISNLLPQPYHGILQKIKDVVTVSIAAQIGTAPLIILYFHRFSTHFLLSNLLVLPLITIIMYAAVIMLLLTPFTVLQQGMALGVDYLINLLNGLLLQLTQLPLASIDNLWTDFLEIVLYYVCIYLFIRYLNLRTASRAITTLTAIWLMVGYHLLNTINRL